MEHEKSSPLRIGIIGAGFSGTALAANLARLKYTSFEIYLCEKTGQFGQGDAYRTRRSFHLLNVRAKDMSAFEDDAPHFVNWLRANQKVDFSINHQTPLEEQFVSRSLYREYLQALLDGILNTDIKLQLRASEVVDVQQINQEILLIFKDGSKQIVDKVVFALGNNPISSLPFTIPAEINAIHNPWDENDSKNIGQDDPVLIIGTGLSMIDMVLSLYHQQHRGKIIAVSRHGLLPLPHTDAPPSFMLSPDNIPSDIAHLTKFLRLKCKNLIHENKDWRSVINALREHIPAIWRQLSLFDKKQFLRHLLSYWNIHRHRVHDQTAHFLDELAMKGQLEVVGGKVLNLEGDRATVQLRHHQKEKTFKIKWVINCMGPSLKMSAHHQPLLHSLLQKKFATLDSLHLGFLTDIDGALIDKSGKISSLFYALGAPAKSTFWECSAVPEIRKHCFALAKKLLI